MTDIKSDCTPLIMGRQNDDQVDGLHQPPFHNHVPSKLEMQGVRSIMGMHYEQTVSCDKTRYFLRCKRSKMIKYFANVENPLHTREVFRHGKLRFYKNGVLKDKCYSQIREYVLWIDSFPSERIRDEMFGHELGYFVLTQDLSQFFKTKAQLAQLGYHTIHQIMRIRKVMNIKNTDGFTMWYEAHFHMNLAYVDKFLQPIYYAQGLREGFAVAVDYIFQLKDATIEKIMGGFDYLSNVISSYVTGPIYDAYLACKKKILDVFGSLWKTVENVKQFMTDCTNTVRYLKWMALMFLVVTTAVIMGLGFKYFIDIFRSGTEPQDYGPQMETEAGTFCSSLASYLTSLFKCPDDVFGKLRYAASTITIVGGGAIMAKRFMLHIAGYLPNCIRKLVLYYCGGTEALENERIDQWIESALVLIQYDKTPSVVSSPIYASKLKEVIDNFPRVNISDLHVRSMLQSTYSKLLVTNSVLASYQLGNVKRSTPYCIHLAAQPGIGKTTVSERLAKELTECNSNEIYTRPNSRFWSGFTPNSKVILWDEWLVGSDDEEMAKEFLWLVSSAEFQPELASVDNPTVGIKGTRAAPDLVITMNNTLHNRPENINTSALQRRRDKVFEMKIAPAYLHLYKDFELDLGKLTKQQIMDVAWASFYEVPSVHKPSFQKKGPYTLKQVVNMCKIEKTAKDKISKTISEMSKIGDTERDVDSVLEAFTKLVSGNVCPEPSVAKDLLGFGLGWKPQVHRKKGQTKTRSNSKKEVEKRRALNEDKKKKESEKVTESLCSGESSTFAEMQTDWLYRPDDQLDDTVPPWDKSKLGMAAAKEEFKRRMNSKDPRAPVSVPAVVNKVLPHYVEKVPILETCEHFVLKLHHSTSTTSEENGGVTLHDLIDPETGLVPDSDLSGTDSEMTQSVFSSYDMPSNETVIEGEKMLYECGILVPPIEFVTEEDSEAEKKTDYGRTLSGYSAISSGDIDDQNEETCSDEFDSCVGPFTISSVDKTASFVISSEVAPMFTLNDNIPAGSVYYMDSKSFHRASDVGMHEDAYIRVLFDRKNEFEGKLKHLQRHILTCDECYLQIPTDDTELDLARLVQETFEIEDDHEAYTGELLNTFCRCVLFSAQGDCRECFSYPCVCDLVNPPTYDPDYSVSAWLSFGYEKFRDAWADLKKKTKGIWVVFKKKAKSVMWVILAALTEMFLVYLALISALMVFCKIVLFFCPPDDKYEGQSFGGINNRRAKHGDNPNKAKARARAARKTNMRKFNWKAHSNSFDKAIVRVTCCGNSLYGIGIYGKTILLPYHFFIDQTTNDMFLDGTEIAFKIGEVVHKKSFVRQHLIFNDFDDYALYTLFDNKVAPFKDIRKNFVKEDEIEEWERGQGALYVNGPGVAPIYCSMSKGTNLRYACGGTNFEHPDFIKYPVPTVTGMCGGPVVLMGSTAQPKVLGIHIAGTHRTGAGAFVSSESLYPEKKVEEFEPEEEDGDFIAQGDFIPEEMAHKFHGIYNFVNAYKMITGRFQGTLSAEEIDTLSDLTYMWKVQGLKEVDFCEFAHMLPDNTVIRRIKRRCDHEPIRYEGEVPVYHERRKIPLVAGMPNAAEFKRLERGGGINVPRVSGLKRSVLSRHLDYPPEKVKPALHPQDPRCDGTDPIERNLFRAFQFEKDASCDIDTLALVRDECYNYWKNKKNPIKPRILSLEEAIGGIPEKLRAMDLKTSVGIPYIGNHKRSDFFYRTIDGELVITPFCLQEIARRETDILNEEVDGADFNWCGFQKDELTKPKKIVEGKTRLIYANSVIDLILFRKYFGWIMAKFNLADDSPSAIGKNQYSWDMDEIKNYLDEVPHRGYIDGDYKDYDMSHHPDFQMSAYGIFFRLNEPYIPEAVNRYFRSHETHSGCIVGDMWFKPVCMHFSGLALTTIGNNIYNELYWRYVCKLKAPGMDFDRNVRMQLLGDDHLVTIHRDYCPKRINPLVFKEEMAKINLKYTSADKDKEVTEELKKEFMDLTFLGATPRKVAGRWTGRMPMSTIREIVHWTRNNNLTLREECRVALEMSTLHGHIEYERLYWQIDHALRNEGMPSLPKVDVETTAIMVSSRTATEGGAFGWFFPQLENYHAQMETVSEIGEGLETPPEIDEGFTQTKVGRDAVKTTIATKMMSRREKAICAPPLAGKDGMKTWVKRKDLSWDKTKNTGDSIFTVDLPFGLTALGNQLTVQNKNISMFQYFHGTMEIEFLINSNKMQQGMLIAAILPMPAALESRAWYNMSSLVHVLMSAGKNKAYQLPVNLAWIRDFIRTDGTDVPARLLVKVVSPMKSIKSTDKVDIAIFAKFPQFEFKLQKALRRTYIPDCQLEEFNEMQRKKHNAIVRKEDAKRKLMERFETDYEAWHPQGNTSSNISYGDVLGNVSTEPNVQGGIKAAATYGGAAGGGESMDNMLPFHSREMANGSVPVHPNFPGFSTNSRAVTSNLMALNHDQLRFDPDPFGDNNVSCAVENLCQRSCVTIDFGIDTNKGIGDLLWSAELSSLFGRGEGSTVSVAETVLEYFHFWRADFIFDIRAVKTIFHSTSLVFYIAYGTNVDPTFDEINNYYTEIINISADDEHTVIRVPYNAPTEFLRTYDNSPNYIDYSMGRIGFFLLNELVAPDTVAQDIQILGFMTMEDVEVAVPKVYRAISTVTPDTVVKFKVTTTDDIPEIEEDWEYHAQVGTENDHEEEVSAADGASPAEVTVVNTCGIKNKRKPYIANPFSTFRFAVANLLEVCRRYKYFSEFSSTDSIVRHIQNKPTFDLCEHFGGWVGSLRYRLITRADTDAIRVFLIPSGGNNDQPSGICKQGKETLTFTNLTPNQKIMTMKATIPDYETIGRGAIELVCTGGLGYLEFTVPYLSHWRYSPILNGVVDQCGVIGIYSETRTGIHYDMYQAAGDDFRLGLFKGGEFFVRIPKRQKDGVTVDVPLTVGTVKTVLKV